MQINNLTTLNL